MIRFEALDKPRAIRKALSYWYKNCSETSLKEFISCCSGTKEEKQYIITFTTTTKK